jgi:hypothetical protein
MRSLGFLGVLLALCAWFTEATAQSRQPLVMPGRTELFQRVITRPGAELAPRPGAAGQPVPGFSVFYVYGRQGNALELGDGTTGRIAGWVAAERTIDWPHGMVLAFNNPAGRDRAMFFRDADTLRATWNAPDRAARAAALRAAARPGNDGPVIALEPEAFIDITRNFYLLPVVSAERLDPPNGAPATLLGVVSAPATPPVERPPPDALANFKGSIVFVVDTTISMEPYITRTREAIRRVIARIADTAVREKFRFGMVAFRATPDGRTVIEYVTRTVALPDFQAAPGALLPRIDQVQQAERSTGAFNEDSIAGVKAALDDVPWGEYGGRYIILITDAGAREPPDPTATTGLRVEELNAYARSEAKGVAIYAIHLKTPEGRANHASAERQYRTLTDFGAAGSLYYEVPQGRVQDFGAIVDTLADAILEQVAQTVGRPIAGAAPQTPQQQEVARQAAMVGNAMRLAYLGRVNHSAAPDVVASFTVDEDFTDPQPTRRPLDVRVLLTRNQLSDLSATVKAIVEAGSTGRLAPETTFSRLRAAMAAVTRDPRRISQLQRLGGAFNELLADLPYQSQIMEITEDSWVTMGPAARQTVLNTLESKLRLYDAFYRQTELWVSLDRARAPGEAMYPVPLSALP